MGPYNFVCQWGRVTKYEPPKKLVFLWQISPKSLPVPDPAKASEVEVRFISENPTTTRVELEHRNFENHGEGAENYREEMASEFGWTKILANYVNSIKIDR